MYVNVGRRSRTWKAQLRRLGCCEVCVYQPREEMHPRCRLLEDALEDEVLERLRRGEKMAA